MHTSWQTSPLPFIVKNGCSRGNSPSGLFSKDSEDAPMVMTIQYLVRYLTCRPSPTSPQWQGYVVTVEFLFRYVLRNAFALMRLPDSCLPDWGLQPSVGHVFRIVRSDWLIVIRTPSAFPFPANNSWTMALDLLHAAPPPYLCLHQQ